MNFHIHHISPFLATMDMRCFGWWHDVAMWPCPQEAVRKAMPCLAENQATFWTSKMDAAGSAPKKRKDVGKTSDSNGHKMIKCDLNRSHWGEKQVFLVGSCLVSYLMLSHSPRSTFSKPLGMAPVRNHGH